MASFIFSNSSTFLTMIPYIFQAYNGNLVFNFSFKPFLKLEIKHAQQTNIEQVYSYCITWIITLGNKFRWKRSYFKEVSLRATKIQLDFSRNQPEIDWVGLTQSADLPSQRLWYAVHVWLFCVRPSFSLFEKCTMSAAAFRAKQHGEILVLLSFCLYRILHATNFYLSCFYC
jgi:hypothetical protein